MAAHEEVLKLIDDYFTGVYTGNTGLLQSLFDPHAQVFGEVNGLHHHKPISVYLEGVAARKSPKELNEPFRMKTLGIDVMGDIASARLYSPMLGFEYCLYLTLAHREAGWQIVNKTYAAPLLAI
ncbi:nuclear transport factor 2 family protein [Undibacterium sp. TJN25]|uniref:nuclear transport factor 2 family protein n=1 Tax=Undibacterium sp. TJN25 TaxID=3413056 RepID=UPI003BF08935